MPHFDIDEVMRYAGDRHEADAVLDLSGQDADTALETLARVLPEAARRHRSMIVRFPPAGPDSGETLFLPVGRFLMERKRAGELSHLSNLLELGAGFYIEFPPSDDTE